MKDSLSAILFALLCLCSGCTAFRAVRQGAPSYNSFTDFQLDTIHCRKAKQVFVSSENHDDWFEQATLTGSGFYQETLGDYFGRVRGNGALFIVRNDSVLLERYYGDFTRLSPSNVFSISKAVTSLLCGIAVDEGYISVSDPVAEFIPELCDADSMFRQLTVEHLLDMRTGLDFKENYGWHPFSKMARLYYGDNVVNQFKSLHFKEKPGSSHYYNSMATALLGVAIERAVGMPYARYLEEKVWKPLDMEADAYISLDDSRHRQAKAYGGLVSNVRDIAKIGRLFLNHGVYDGKRIVSKEWIDRTTHSSLENEAYSYGWNNITTRLNGVDVVMPRYFALGLYGQVLFCDPEQNLIFVTLGEKKGAEYHLLFDNLTKK